MEPFVKEALKREGLFTLLVVGSIIAGAFLFLFPADRFEKTKEFFSYSSSSGSLLSGTGVLLTTSGTTLSQPSVIPPSPNPQTLPPVLPASIKALGQPFISFAEKLGPTYSLVLVPTSDTIIFETLTPYAQLVSIKKVNVLKEGVSIGIIYQISRKDPSIGDTFDFLKRLATTIQPHPEVQIQETVAYGQAGFVYIHLAKKDNFRIVISSKDGLVYGWDVLPGYREVFEPLFRSL